ncbi:MAG: hypothetical protein HY913_12325 [Desulfomonile tiedjei]|nr:hypothetical protein [Desulfomonile tiedjei]
MTANSSDGKKFFQTSRIYATQATDSRSTQTVLGPENKLGLIRDTSIQPFAPKEESIEVQLPPGVTDAIIEVNLSYRPRPGNVYPIHEVVRKVSLGAKK